MRLVHISDLHVSSFTRDLTALCDKRLLGLLNFFVRRRHAFHAEYFARAFLKIRTLSPDWVVITGDITTVGSPEEFRKALALLLPFVESKPPFQTIFIPGNHDAYVGNRTCRAALVDAFRQLNGGRWQDLDALPAEIALPELRLLLVNECRPNLPWQSSGTLPDADQRWLAERWRQPRTEHERRVLLGHFPARDAQGRPLARRRALDGADFVRDALRAGHLHVALCGHRHEPFLRREPNGALEICAGALAMHGRINVLDYSPQSGQFSQFWEDVSGSGRRVIPIADTVILPARP